jgi:tRNA(Ile)-lysidine synthetase-like protein
MTDLHDRLVRLVSQSLANECRVTDGARVFAACSGGADSVALVSLLSKQTRVPLAGVLYVDHGLRDGTLEAQSAKAAATRAGVPFEALTLSLGPGSNLQARARAARYAALEAATEAGALIATGHTETDQAETVIQRLLRGAGPRGLQGIHPRRGAVVRPMLAIARHETRALGLPYVEDPTNATLAYQRNRIRHTLLAQLRDEEPGIDTSLALVAAQAAGEHQLLSACLARAPLTLEEVTPLGLAPIEAWLRLGWPEDLPVSREVIRGLARAAVEGRDYGPARLDAQRIVSLRGRRVVHEACPDPRMRVVAPSPGAYRLLNHRLVITLDGVEQQTQRAIYTAQLDTSTLVWPLIAHQRIPPSEPTTGSGNPYEFQLTDGSGRVLWDSERAEENSKAGRDLHIALFVC